MSDFIFNVPDMSCGHCKMRIEKVVGESEGVSSVSADPETKKVQVTSSLAADVLITLIDEAGYDATQE